MSQLEIDYPRGKHLVEDGWRAVRRAFEDVCDAMSNKAVADLLGVTEPALSDAIAERTNKRIAAKWIAVLILLAPERHAKHLIDALCNLREYDAEKRVPDPAEDLRERRDWVKDKAPGLVELFEKETGGRW